MIRSPARMDMVAGSAMVSAALVVAWWLSIPSHLLLPLLITGLFLTGEGVWTQHAYASADRLERWYTVQAKAPKAEPGPISQPRVPRAVKELVWDWAGNSAPTTRRYAEERHGVTQEQWQRTVNWAVRNGLGELVPGEGGNRKLRWTASLNEALNLLDGLA